MSYLPSNGKLIEHRYLGKETMLYMIIMHRAINFYFDENFLRWAIAIFVYSVFSGEKAKGGIRSLG